MRVEPTVLTTKNLRQFTLKSRPWYNQRQSQLARLPARGVAPVQGGGQTVGLQVIVVVVCVWWAVERGRRWQMARRGAHQTPRSYLIYLALRGPNRRS